MADNRSIVITLKLKSADDKSDVNNQVDTQKTEEESDNDKKSKSAYAALALQVGSTAINEVAAWAEYYWNKELTLTDDYIGQRNKNIALTQIGRAVNVVTTTGSWAAMGAALGPVGAIIGGILGAAVSVSGIVRSNVQGQEQEDIAIRQMNAQLSFTRSRAGWSLEAASIGEDL